MSMWWSLPCAILSTIVYILGRLGAMAPYLARWIVLGFWALTMLVGVFGLRRIICERKQERNRAEELSQ